MANAKKKGRRRQGAISKVTSAIALFVALSPVIQALRVSGGNMVTFGREVTRMYTGVNSAGVFDVKNLAEGYLPLAGGIAFKKGMSALVRAAPLKI